MRKERDRRGRSDCDRLIKKMLPERLRKSNRQIQKQGANAQMVWEERRTRSQNGSRSDLVSIMMERRDHEYYQGKSKPLTQRGRSDIIERRALNGKQEVERSEAGKAPNDLYLAGATVRPCEEGANGLVDEEGAKFRR